MGECAQCFKNAPQATVSTTALLCIAQLVWRGGGGVGSGGIRSSFLPWIEYKKRDNLSVFTSHFSFYRGPHKSFTCYLKSTVDQFDIG